MDILRQLMKSYVINISTGHTDWRHYIAYIESNFRSQFNENYFVDFLWIYFHKYKK